MSMKHLMTVVAVAASSSAAFAQIAIPTVPVGNPGNAPDPLTGNLYGSVGYSYNIGRSEVTNAQYAAFLNAVAATDTNSLYNTSMAGPFGGITRSGVSGTYTYATVSGQANNPVNFVSFWDSTRFANWLHNGQQTGAQNNSTTEDGAYTLTAGGITANAVTRNAGWQWAVTSENEWYKAAYHQPAAQGGDADNYWLYPTSSNTITTAAANYFFGGVLGSLAPVGSYAANSYGTFDMGGNVFEWNDTIINGSFRVRRGGAFNSVETGLRSDSRNLDSPTSENYFYGFRVSQVPGPSSIVLLAIAGLGAGRRRHTPNA